MLRKYISDIAFIQVLNLLVKPVWILVIDRAVQNKLSAEAYGNYFALINVSLIFFIILDLGITSFNATQVSKDPKKLKHLFGNLLGLKLMLSVVYVVVVYLFGYVFGYDSYEFGLLLMLCAIQIITSFNQYFRSCISAFQWFKWDGLFMVLDRVIIIVLCAILIWGGLAKFELSISTFIWAQIIGLGFVSITLLLFIYFKMERIKLSFSLKAIFPLLKRSWPFGLLVALMGLYNYLDGVMLKSLASNGNEAAAVYAMGYRLFFALFMFAQVFSNVLLSLYGRHINDRQFLFKLTTFNGKLLFYIGMIVGLVAFAYQTEIIDLLYPNRGSEQASETFSILMFSFLGSALVLVYGTLMTAKEQMKKLNWSAFITLILNISLNAYLIPIHGPIGAAYATLASQMLFGLSCFYLSKKTFRFHYNKTELLRLIITAVLLFLSIVYLRQYLKNTSVHLALILVAIVIGALIIKLLDRKALNSLQ